MYVQNRKVVLVRADVKIYFNGADTRYSEKNWRGSLTGVTLGCSGSVYVSTGAIGGQTHKAMGI